MSDCKFEIKSVTGQVLRVYEDRVELTQSGVRGAILQGLQGVKTYYYNAISTIQFKNCGWTNGFIEFTFAGGNDRRGGAWSGAGNDNRFTFGKPTIGAAKKLAAEMEEVNAYLQERLKFSRQPQFVSQSSGADEIMKFKELAEQGIITSEEFEAKKKQILGI